MGIGWGIGRVNDIRGSDDRRLGCGILVKKKNEESETLFPITLNVSYCKRLPLFQSGKPPSTEIRYGKYPLEIRSKSTPLSEKVLVVQAFA